MLRCPLLRCPLSTRASITLALALCAATSSAVAQDPFVFAAPSPFPLPTIPSALAPFDLDGDGDDDLVVFSQPDTLWLAGDGVGGFGAPQVLLPFVVNSIDVGDLDEDGLPDLAVSDVAGGISLHFANPTGGYTAGPVFSASLPFPQVTIVDFDGDAILDICFLRNAAAGNAQIAVFLGTGVGSFAPTPVAVAIDPNPNELLVGDLDGDGDADCVVGHVGLGVGASSFTVVRGNGLGGFEAPQSFPLPGLCTGLASGDLDEDGLEDLIVSALTLTSFCGPNAFLFLQTATGFAQTTEFSGACGPHESLLADLDLDGHLDLLTTDGGDLIAAVNWFDLRRGLGDGTFEPPQTVTINLAGTGRPALLDGDLDGRVDLVLPGFQAEVQVYRNETPFAAAPFRRGDCNGDGAVQGIADAIYLLGWGFQGGPEPPCEAAADCNGDGAVTAVADAIYVLGWQFQGGAEPPAPFPDCGVEPTPGGLDCASYPAGGCP